MQKIADEISLEIIETYRWLSEKGYNQMTSGNISVRFPAAVDAPRELDVEGSGDLWSPAMLITPSGVGVDELTVDKIVHVQIDDHSPVVDGLLKPSSEWRLHRDLLQHRPEINAVIHTHSIFATAIAMTRSEIPACHYMVAAFGGDNIRCAPYARFGTEELSKLTLEAMDNRSGCLLSNHGMVVVGESLKKALWYAVQLETLAQQYYHSRVFGDPVLLTPDQIEATRTAMEDYFKIN